MPHRWRHRLPGTLLLLLLTAGIGLVTGCRKVPLLAPTSSTISVSAPVSVLPINGSTQVTAVVISSAGQAVHDGTTVTFTTTLGSFAPGATAQTKNGSATVTFLAGTQSGTASIVAMSGSATSTPTTTGSTTTALTIKIGAAAAASISLSANPVNVPASGGTSTITATVFDANDNVLPGVSVNFTTTAGTVSPSTATTNSSGRATTTLTTSAAATVSATAGGGITTAPTVQVGVVAAPAVSISGPSAAQTAGQPTTFTVGVTPSTGGGTITDVRVDFGDGNSQDLGTLTGTGISVSHTYSSAGTYVATLSVTDSTGQVTKESTSVTVTAAVPISITVAVTSPTTTPYTHPIVIGFTATVASNGSVSAPSIDHYSWNFGDGNTTTTTTGPAASHLYQSASPSSGYTVTVTAVGVNGAEGTAQVVIIVQ